MTTETQKSDQLDAFFLGWVARMERLRYRPPTTEELLRAAELRGPTPDTLVGDLPLAGAAP
ncbi:MAG: hypothetical protein KGM96_15415 [Acidobacteriota bacterium]|nr:hypothetical protein [Xanthomonadaceae bacterium]MDE3188900.1 hypothetical protein [Acidobacteriota bacterium]